MKLDDHEFDALITRAMDELPQAYIREMHNVAIVMSDEPNAEQRERLRLRGDQVLLGLFEGVPRTQQSGSESGLLPGKITLFKNSLLVVSHDEKSLFEQIKRTLWHEIAHYYGLNHDDMHERQVKHGD
ncbi:MAG TPA: metallopeptidase family protein [Candidatus Saccharimonadaceae bacterium]|nr:metallopeptidase family protein [Candidatus Saccharimonadaceae bacterium]